MDQQNFQPNPNQAVQPPQTPQPTTSTPQHASATPQQPSSFPKQKPNLFLPLLSLIIGIGIGVGSTFAFYSNQAITENSPDKTIETIANPSPVTTQSIESPEKFIQELVISQSSGECNAAFDIGYLAGLVSHEATTSAEPVEYKQECHNVFVYGFAIGEMEGARQRAEARDTQRRKDLYSITNAIYQYATENNGNLPSKISNQYQDAGISGANLAADLVPTYLEEVPFDPSGGSPNITQYTIFLETSGWVHASASSEINAGEYLYVRR